MLKERPVYYFPGAASGSGAAVPVASHVRVMPVMPTFTNENKKPEQPQETEMSAKDTYEKTSKDGMDAWMKSGNIAMKGFETLITTCAGLAQESMEKNTEAMKSLLACRTLNELTETQTRVAQESFDDFVKGATKLSEVSVKIVTDSFDPISAQFSKTMGKAMKKGSDSLAA